MTLQDTYRYLVGGYYGVMEMDDYSLKVYILKDIENYIKDFISVSPVEGYTIDDYKKDAENIKDNLPLKRKLQDALLVLNKIEAPLELILMVKKRIKELNSDD